MRHHPALADEAEPAPPPRRPFAPAERAALRRFLRAASVAALVIGGQAAAEQAPLPLVRYAADMAQCASNVADDEFSHAPAFARDLLLEACHAHARAALVNAEADAAYTAVCSPPAAFVCDRLHVERMSAAALRVAAFTTMFDRMNATFRLSEDGKAAR